MYQVCCWGAFFFIKTLFLNLFRMKREFYRNSAWYQKKRYVQATSCLTRSLPKTPQGSSVLRGATGKRSRIPLHFLYVLFIILLLCRVFGGKFSQTFSPFIHAPFNPVTGTILLLTFFGACFFSCPHLMMREVRLLSFSILFIWRLETTWTERVLCGTTVVAHTHSPLQYCTMWLCYSDAKCHSQKLARALWFKVWNSTMFSVESIRWYYCTTLQCNSVTMQCST